jgi:hypothetical protein
VGVEDKAAPSENGGSTSGNDKSLSWWDIQDENAALPMRDVTSQELRRLLTSRRDAGADGDSYETATKVAKGAFHTIGKAVSHAVTGQDGGSSSSPPLSVVVFKLLDLVKMHDDFVKRHVSGKRGNAISVRPPKAVRSSSITSAKARASTGHHYTAPTQQQQQQPQHQHQQSYRSASTTAAAAAVAPAPPRSVTPNHHQPPQRSVTAPARQQQQKPVAPEASLMDFGPPIPSGSGVGGGQGIYPGETKQQKLQREYRQKAAKAPRVWDPVDERWVDVDPKVANSAAASMPVTKKGSSGDLMMNGGTTKTKGLSLAESQAAASRKSANVQQAVASRVSDMRQSQMKAVNEVREREASKKAAENEEDMVRRKLEPKIKQWSEEHGKKKQLRALLGSLHIILWPDANWKPVGLGDLLDDKVCIKVYRKATLVVHPDKAQHYDAERRFVAKRVFDALTQAKAEYDNGKK